MTFALTTLQIALGRAAGDPTSENMARVATSLDQWLALIKKATGAEMDDFGAVHDVFHDCVVSPLMKAETAEHDRVYIATKGGTDPWAAI